MRLFYALPLPESIVGPLWAWGQALAPHATGFRWSPAANYHITTAFLGDSPRESLENLEVVGAAVARACGGFSLALAQAGTFSGIHGPRVLWAGLQPEAQLRSLAACLAAELDSIGQPRDRQPFRPHITLARANRQGVVPALPALPQLAPFAVERLVLFESVSQSTGVAYCEIASWPLV